MRTRANEEANNGRASRRGKMKNDDEARTVQDSAEARKTGASAEG